MNYEKLNIGLDRAIIIVEKVAINGGNNRVYMKTGESAEITDISTGEVIGVSEFKVDVKGISIDNKDDYRIIIELKKTSQGYRYILNVNIPKLLYNTNERNANNLQHLSEVNQIIEKKLSEYGVIVDMTKARISSLEININSTDKKLYDAMKIMRKGFNTTDETIFIAEKRNVVGSIMKQNKYMKIKVYDKTQQLKDTNQLYENENLVRVEVTAIHPSAINTITGDNPCMDGVIENWDKLEKWFKDTINKQIKKPCDEFNKAVENEMVAKLKQGCKTYDILATEGTKGNLVDLEIFSRAMKRYYKEVGKTKPHTVIKNTKNRFEKTDNELYDSLIGNIDALEKLWDGIGI